MDPERALASLRLWLATPVANGRSRDAGQASDLAVVQASRYELRHLRAFFHRPHTSGLSPAPEGVTKYPGWDSNPHWIDFESIASADWATRAGALILGAGSYET